MSVNRRTFLTGLGGIFAVASLPSFGEDDPSLFPARGNFERLALAYQHVHLGLKKPFSVLHISDTHFTAAYPDEDEARRKLRDIRTRTFGGRQEEAFRDSLAWAKRNVDYVVHTGDLIDWQSRANYDLVKKYLGKDIGCALGNHEFSHCMWLGREERTEAYKNTSRAKLTEVFGCDIELQSTVINGVNFVMLDDAYGTVTARQVERFAAEVKKGLPIVLCMHVPFFSDEIWRANGKYWNANRTFTSAAVPKVGGDYASQQTNPVTRDFIASLRKEPLLKAILAGHLHITIQDRFSPTAMQYVVGGNFMFHGEEILFT